MKIMRENENTYCYNETGSWKFLTVSMTFFMFLIFASIISFVKRDSGLLTAEKELNSFNFNFTLNFTIVAVILIFAMTIYYWNISRNIIFTIKKNRNYIYQKKRNIIHFNQDDIYFCEYITSMTYPITWRSGFEFLNIHLKSGDKITMTNLVGNLDEISTEFLYNCKTRKTIFPILTQIA